MEFHLLIVFSQARPTNYFGKLNVDSIVEWIKKKTGVPSNRINNHHELAAKVK